MMKRPTRITLFCWGSMIFNVLGLISFIVTKYIAKQPTPHSAIPEFMGEVNMVIGLGIAFYCCLKMLKAEAKARTIYIGYMIYGTIFSYITFATMDYTDIIAASQGILSKDGVQTMYYVSGSIPMIITLLFLYTPKSNKWFGKSSIVEQNNLTAQAQGEAVPSENSENDDKLSF